MIFQVNHIKITTMSHPLLPTLDLTWTISKKIQAVCEAVKSLLWQIVVKLKKKINFTIRIKSNLNWNEIIQILGRYSQMFHNLPFNEVLTWYTYEIKYFIVCKNRVYSENFMFCRMQLNVSMMQKVKLCIYTTHVCMIHTGWLYSVRDL